MQRYHQPIVSCGPTRPAVLEAESRRLADATEAFLAAGGQIQQCGHQMKDRYPFIVCAAKTPVYAHLFERPGQATAPECAEAVQPSAEPAPAPSDDQLAGRVMARAALRHTPRQIAEQLQLTEKKVRQLCRDYHITARQR